jgi:tetratricopeptide (TPR) repeat protein
VLIRALEIERDPEALCLLAGIRYGEGNLIEARLLLEEAVGKQPGYVEALNSLGAIYNVVRNWDSALDALNRVIAMAPSFPEAWLNLGSSQRGAGRFDQAEASWKKVLTLAPKMADAWYNLGILYLENPIGTRDRIQQLTDSINAFNAFKRGATGNDPNVDKFIEEARLLIKQEQDRRNEQLKGTPPEDGKGKPPADGEGGLK